MPINPVSSSLASFQAAAAQASTSPIRQGPQKLATAPASVDLSGARDAFSSVQQLLQGSEPGKANPSPEGGGKPQKLPATDLVAFGKTLMSGVLDSAQDSVKSLLGDIQAARNRSQRPAQGGEVAVNSPAASTRVDAGAGSRSIGTLINTRA